jgi:hypothetical protein
MTKPYERWRHPPGCPDSDWCSGNGVCYWDCQGTEDDIDPRDPDPKREGFFRDHNCWRCKSGEKPCANGNPNQCDYPHARND